MQILSKICVGLVFEGTILDLLVRMKHILPSFDKVINAEFDCTTW